MRENQATFAQAGFWQYRKTPRREQFLAEMQPARDNIAHSASSIALRKGVCDGSANGRK